MLQEGTRFFTSESVTMVIPIRFRPDFRRDTLDAHLAQDPHGARGVRNHRHHRHGAGMGEITSKAKVITNQIVRDTIARIG